MNNYVAGLESWRRESEVKSQELMLGIKHSIYLYRPKERYPRVRCMDLFSSKGSKLVAFRYSNSQVFGVGPGFISCLSYPYRVKF